MRLCELGKGAYALLQDRKLTFFEPDYGVTDEQGVSSPIFHLEPSEVGVIKQFLVEELGDETGERVRQLEMSHRLTMNCLESIIDLMERGAACNMLVEHLRNTHQSVYLALNGGMQNV